MSIGQTRARVVRAGKLALAFLTIVPVRFRDSEVSDADLAASRFGYPLVGAAIGLVLAGLSAWLTGRHASSGISAFLLIFTGFALTGGLHLDGLADTADGLFLWGDRERRLGVMRDPHVGSFGVAAVALVVLGKYAAIESLTGSGRAWGVLGAATLSRTLVLVSAGLTGYARPQGTGRILVEATTRHDAFAAMVVALAVGAICAGTDGLFSASLALALALTLTRIARSRLGGVTGDTLGALIETSELVFLLSLSLFRPV